jgi:hypothetical protein
MESEAAVTDGEAAVKSEGGGVSELPGAAAKEIKKCVKKDGQDMYLVAFEGDGADAERWLSESELDRPDLMEKFKAQKKRNRGAAQNSGDAKKPAVPARQIQEIRGILANGSERMFVVRFVGTDKDEAVPKAMMHKLYLKELVKYYEAHIEIPAVARMPVAANTPVMPRGIPMPGVMPPRPYFMPNPAIPNMMLPSGVAPSHINVANQVVVPNQMMMPNVGIQNNQM